MAKVISAVMGNSPANVIATLQAGGNLPVGVTYYYRVARCGPHYNYYGNDNSLWWRSVPSVEVSATTDATHRTIRIAWDDDGGEDYHTFYIWRVRTAGNYSYYDRRTDVLTHNFIQIGSHSIGGLRGYEMPVSGGRFYIDDAGQYTEVCYPIHEYGVPNIVLSGGDASDPLTLYDVVDWMQDNGWGNNVQTVDYYTGNNLPVVIYMTATLRNNGDLYFKIPKRVHFIQQYGKIFFYGGDTTFQMGERPDPSKDWTENGCIWQCMSSGASYSGTYGNFLMYDSIMWGQPASFRPDFHMFRMYLGPAFHMYNQSGFKCEILNSIYIPGEVGSRGRLAPVSALMRNSMLDIYSAEFGVPFATFENIQGPGYLLGKFATQACRTDEYQNMGKSSYDVVCLSGRRDSEVGFYHINYRCNAEPYMVLRYYPYLADTQPYHIARMCKLSVKVVDETGDPIAGATLKVYDKNGKDRTYLFSSTLNANIMSKTETQLQVQSAAISEFAVGDIVRINEEDMLITGISDPFLTVERGYNGTAPAKYYGTSSPVDGLYVFKPMKNVSDADGLFPEIPVVFAFHRTPVPTRNGPWTTYTFTDADSISPHTIVIERDGYRTYTSILTIDGNQGPIDEVIAMVPKSEYITTAPLEVSMDNPDIEVEVGLPEILVMTDIPSVDVVIKKTDIEVTVEGPGIDVEVDCG